MNAFHLLWMFTDDDPLCNIFAWMGAQKDPILEGFIRPLFFRNCHDRFFVRQFRRVTDIGFIKGIVPFLMIFSYCIKEQASCIDQYIAESIHFLFRCVLFAQKQNRKRIFRKLQRKIIAQYAFERFY